MALLIILLIMVDTAKKIQEKLAEKLAMDFINSLPKNHYTSIRELGELQHATELSIELKELKIKEEDFIMHFPVTKSATWTPNLQEECVMYITKQAIVMKNGKSEREQYPFFEIESVN